MEKQTILDGNKLIAEFMGAKIGNGGTKKYPVYIGVPVTHSGKTQRWTFSVKDFRYHLSWDWLMPVIDKICNVCKPNSEAHYYWNSAKSDIRIFRETIQVTHAETVKFIKWYNTNKK